MKLRTLLPILLVSVSSLSCAAQDIKGYWRAASQAANSITGDIEISDSKITINFTAFPMVQARTLSPSEVSSVFDADVNTGPTGTLYHVPIAAARRFLHRNTLCGTEDTEWMATYASGRTLQVAFFSGAAPPVFTFDAISNSPDHCGNYTYER